VGLPADYPGLHVHERLPADLPEAERFQLLVEEICEAECRAERQRLIREHGPVEAGRTKCDQCPSRPSTTR
jgi:hypothetical protein